MENSLGLHPYGIHPALRKTLTVGQERRTPSMLHAGAAALRLTVEDRKERWKNPAAEVERIALMGAISLFPGMGIILGPDMVEHFVEQRHPGWKARATFPSSMVERYVKQIDHGWDGQQTKRTDVKLTDAETNKIANQFIQHVQTQAQQMAQKPRNPQQSEARRWLAELHGKRSKLRLQVRQQVISNLKHVTRSIQMQNNPNRAKTGSRTVFRSGIAPEVWKSIAQQRETARNNRNPTPVFAPKIQAPSISKLRPKTKPSVEEKRAA